MYFRYILKLHFAVTFNCKDSNQTLQNIAAHGDVPQSQLWLQKVQQVRRYVTVLFKAFELCDLDFDCEDRDPIFSHDTPILEYASHSQYQAWLQRVQCLLTSNGGKNEPQGDSKSEFSTTTSREKLTSVPSIYHF